VEAQLRADERARPQLQQSADLRAAQRRLLLDDQRELEQARGELQADRQAAAGRREERLRGRRRPPPRAVAPKAAATEASDEERGSSVRKLGGPVPHRPPEPEPEPEPQQPEPEPQQPEPEPQEPEPEPEPEPEQADEIDTELWCRAVTMALAFRGFRQRVRASQRDASTAAVGQK
jgi:hypothetical protein